MKIKFKSNWTGKEGEWNPDTEGYYAVAFRPGVDKIWLRPDGNGNPRHLQLASGCVGRPSKDLEFARRDLAECVVRWPESEGHLYIVKLPFAFTNRESWVVVEWWAQPDLVRAANTVDWSFFWAADAFRRGCCPGVRVE